MDFEASAAASDFTKRMRAFLDEEVLPAEPVYQGWRAERRGSPQEWDRPPVIEELRSQARQRGLWNSFLPEVSGLSNVEFAGVAEVSGWSPALAPEAINCTAPDTGNMEMLRAYATPDQKARWLVPLLDGSMRSALAIAEPDAAASDPSTVQTTLRRDGDAYVITGRKWFVSNVTDPLCQVVLVVGRSAPAGPEGSAYSCVLVPRDAPGLETGRNVPMFGYQVQYGLTEVTFRDVRVPVTSLLGEDGEAFAVLRSRLGDNRVHHGMRMVGMAERAIDLMVRRASSRVAFGGPLADQGVVREQIALSRAEVEQARLLVLKTAWLLDRDGAAAAASEVAAITAVCPRMACQVIDRAIQIHGAAGMTDDWPLALLYTWARTLRLANGPDDVHLAVLAREELQRHS